MCSKNLSSKFFDRGIFFIFFIPIMTFSTKRPLIWKSFSPIEHQVWRLLYTQQMERINATSAVHSMLLQGYELANLPSDHCPDALEISDSLFQATGWRLTNAKNPYLSDPDWYAPLSERFFPATNYIRRMEDLDFTPLPDLAHDYFGHMPLMFHLDLAYLQRRIADMFFRANDSKKKDLYSLAWYVIEYSVVKEKWIPKIFWAGLLSSPGDFQRFLNGEFVLQEADLAIICKTDRSPNRTHQKLFVYESFEHMIKIVDEFERSL